MRTFFYSLVFLFSTVSPLPAAHELPAPEPPVLEDIYCHFASATIATNLPAEATELEWQVRYNNENWTTLSATQTSFSFLFTNINSGGGNTLIDFRVRGVDGGGASVTEWSAIASTEVRPERLPNIISTDVFGPCPLFPGSQGRVSVNASASTTLTYTLYLFISGDISFIAENDTGFFEDLDEGEYFVEVNDEIGLCTAETDTLVIVGADAGAMDVEVLSNFNCEQGSWTIEAYSSFSFDGIGYSLDGISYQSESAFPGLMAGTYTVYSIDSALCQTDTTILELTDPSFSINNLVPPQCSPNPGSIVTFTTTPAQDFPFIRLFQGDTEVGTSDNNAFINLPFGDYRAETFVEGCPFSVTFTITPTFPDFTLAGSLISGNCPGEPFQVRIDPTTADGMAYDFEFTQGENPWETDSVLTFFEPGEYQLRARYVGTACTVILPFTIFAPQDFEIGAEPFPSDCGMMNGGINVVPDFGNDFPPFTYELVGVRPPQSGTNFSGLAAGDYLLVGQNRVGCTDTVPVTVPQDNVSFGIFATLVQGVSCLNGDDGAFHISVDGAEGDFEFRINEGAWQTDSLFENLRPGRYELEARLIGSSCGAEGATFLDQGQAFDVGTNIVAANCGENNGRIEVVEDFGNDFPPFEYELLGVRPRQASIFFLNLTEGDYTLVAHNDAGCTDTVQVTVDLGSVSYGIFSTLVQPVNCLGGNDGAFRIGVDGASGDFEFRINEGLWQTDSLFENLEPGRYVFEARLVGTDCPARGVTFLNQGQPFDVGANVIPANCGQSNGRIEVIEDFGNDFPPFEYELLGVRPRQSGTLFGGLEAGDYTLVAHNDVGCTDTVLVIVDLRGIEFDVSVSIVQEVSCLGGEDGSFHVNIDGASGDFEFRINEGPWQTDSLFENLEPGRYVYEARAVGTNCSARGVTFLDQGQTFDVGATTLAADCGRENGSIAVLEDFGNDFPPFEYELLGVRRRQSDVVFRDLGADDYTLIAYNGVGCTDTVRITIDSRGADFGLFVFLEQGVSCSGENNGAFHIGIDGASGDFEFRINEGPWQTDSLFTGLPTGTYDLEARLVGTECSVQGTTTLSATEALDIGAATVAADCGISNGQITVVPDPDNTSESVDYSLVDVRPYQFELTFPDLAAGDYLLVGRTAEGCTDTVMVTVSGGGATFSISPVIEQEVTCPGGADGIIRIDVNGGIIDYEFRLNGGDWVTDSLFPELAAGTYALEARIRDSDCTETGEITLEPPPPFTLAADISDGNCDGTPGNIVLTVMGGDSPIFYSLDGGDTFQDSPVFEEVAPGTYAAVARDNKGCDATQEITVANTGEALIAEATDLLPPTCAEDANGSASIVISSGSGPFTFLWEDGNRDSLRTDLTTGEYRVVVATPSGCETTVTFQLDREPLVVAATISNLGCNESASILLAVSGGTTPYSYQWNDGDNGALRNELNAGTYAVTVTDANGCQETDSYEITNASSLFQAFPDTLICTDSQLSLRPSFPVQNIEWWTEDSLLLGLAPTLTISEAGRILVSGTDQNGCSFTDDFTVSVSSEALIASFLVAGQAVAGDTLVLIENSSPVPENLQWFFRGNGAVLPAFDSLNQHWFVFPDVGTYEIILEARLGGCTSTLIKEIEIVADSSQLESPLVRFTELVNFQVSPNPTTGPFQVDVAFSGERPVDVRVYDLNGTIVAQATSPLAAEHLLNINLTGNQPGSYIVAVNSGTEVHYLTLILQ